MYSFGWKMRSTVCTVADTGAKLAGGSRVAMAGDRQSPRKVSGDVSLLRSQVPKLVLSF